MARHVTKERQLGKAWRNAGIAAVAVGVLVLSTQGVLSAMDRGPVADAARSECGADQVERVSADDHECDR